MLGKLMAELLGLKGAPVAGPLRETHTACFQANIKKALRLDAYACTVNNLVADSEGVRKAQRSWEARMRCMRAKW